MNLQSLSSIDLPALSRGQLASLVRVLRDEHDGEWIDTRTTNRNLIEYIESHKTRLAQQESTAPTVDEPTPEVEVPTAAVASTKETDATNPVVVVVYHKKSDLFHCPDGVVSGIIAKRAFAFRGEKAVFLPGTYYNNDSIVERINELSPKRVLLLDYSMPLDAIKKLKVGTVIVCDHHKDACEQLISTIRAERSLSRVNCPQLAVRFNNNKSGARLTWDYFFSGTEPPALVEYVEDGDLFTFCLPFSELICAGIHSALSPGMSLEEVDSMLSPAWNMTRKEFVRHFKERGNFAKSEKKKRILSAAAKAKVMVIHGRKAVSVEVSEADQDIVSQLGRHLYSQDFFIEHGLKFVAIYHMDGESCYVSLRSGGYNCLPVAKAYGGGGHEQACGFRLAGKFDDYFPDRPIAY